MRRIEGVKKAVQYTLPVEEALNKVRSGSNPELTTREKHTRDCFVVVHENADKEIIENQIKTMANYFEPYDTTVHFIDDATFDAEHTTMPHGGFVIRTGDSGKNKQKIEFNLELGSNPEFTSSVLVAYARAAARLAKDGKSGAFTVLDIPVAYLSEKSGEKLRKELL